MSFKMEASLSEKSLPFRDEVLPLEERFFSEPNDGPYSIYSPAQKAFISYVASISAVFSGLSSFIYYPAISSLSQSLGTSTEAVNLTITSYLVVAGIAPSIIGDTVDQTGRRPVSLIAFTLYLAANIGLASRNSYSAMVILQCLQSAGASGSTSIAYCIISDMPYQQSKALT